VENAALPGIARSRRNRCKTTNFKRTTARRLEARAQLAQKLKSARYLSAIATSLEKRASLSDIETMPRIAGVAFERST
jgi:hypothetical protein